ncbi:MAG: PilN domain-containing protein [Deltaproteobacteria bacterium]|nr:PilN domain-containing protein [Deltaproteobacteria bacterium]
MIKINLLPFRAARKRENVRRQVSIYFLSILFLIMAMFYFNMNFNGRLSTLKAKEEGLRNELKPYIEINQEIARIRKQTKEIQSRLTVIEQLEKERVRPIQLLEEIAHAVPLNRLWLRSLAETGGKITLQGTAMDNDTLARFLTNLDKAPHIENVELISSKLQHFSKYKLDASNFVLTCQTRFEEPGKTESEKPEKKQPDRRR